LLILQSNSQYLVIWRMLKILLTGFIAFSIYSLQAQSDFIVLKKKNTSIQTFFPGSFISCQVDNNDWVNGYIRKIQNDSIYIKPFHEALTIDTWGLLHSDSIFLDVERINVNQITAMPKKDHSFEYIKDGTILEIGAGGYMLLNIINTLSNKDPLFGKNNINRLGIAAGVFTAGLVLHLLRRTYIKIGKKYKLNYIHLNSRPK